MPILMLTQAEIALGRQRAARVSKDVRVIDRALSDAQHSALAETALHLAAEIVERAETREANARAAWPSDAQRLGGCEQEDRTQDAHAPIPA